MKILLEAYSTYRQDYLYSDLIDKGEESYVYNASPSKIIKFPKGGAYNKKYLNKINFMKQNPKYFPKIFQFNEEYVVMEKLDTSTIKKVFDAVKNITKGGREWLYVFYPNMEEEYPEIFIQIKMSPFLLEWHTKIQKFIADIEDEFNGVDFDFNPSNFAVDKQKNIKLIDI